MKAISMTLVALLFAAAISAAETKTYTGTISDSMCVRDHASMKIEPRDQCVRDCVGHAKDVKYVLLHDGHAMVLSNQEAPAKFAGRKVTVTGVYYPKTNVLKVESIVGRQETGDRR
jgi:hypothetical protein